jgi:hypothetical protein
VKTYRSPLNVYITLATFIPDVPRFQTDDGAK